VLDAGRSRSEPLMRMLPGNEQIYIDVSRVLYLIQAPKTGVRGGPPIVTTEIYLQNDSDGPFTVHMTVIEALKELGLEPQ